MYYLLGKIIVCLLFAVLLGALLGWLLKRLSAARQMDMLQEQFDDVRLQYAEKLDEAEAACKQRLSGVSEERNKAKGLLMAHAKRYQIMAKTLKSKNELNELLKQQGGKWQLEKQALQTAVEESDQNYQQLQRKLADEQEKTREFDVTKKQLVETKEQLEKLQRQLQEAEQGKQSIQAQLEAEQKALQERQAQQNEHKLRLDESLKSSKELEERLQQQSNQNEVLIKQLELSKKDYAAVYDKHGALQREHDRLNKEQDELRGMLASAEEKLALSTEQFHKLEADFSKHEKISADVDGLNKQIAMLKAENQKLHDSAGILEKEKRQFAAKLTAAQNDAEKVVTLKSELQALTADKLMLQQKLDTNNKDREQELAETRSELARYKEYLLDTEKKLTEQIERQKQSLTEKDQRLAQQRDECAGHIKQIDTLGREVKMLEQEQQKNQQLKTELEEVKLKLQQAEEREKASTHEEEMAKLRNRITWLEDKNEQLHKQRNDQQKLLEQNDDVERKLQLLEADKKGLAQQLASQDEAHQRERRQWQDSLAEKNAALDNWQAQVQSNKANMADLSALQEQKRKLAEENKVHQLHIRNLKEQLMELEDIIDKNNSTEEPSATTRSIWGGQKKGINLLSKTLWGNKEKQKKSQKQQAKKSKASKQAARPAATEEDSKQDVKPSALRALANQHQALEEDGKPPRKVSKKIAANDGLAHGTDDYPIEAIEGIGKVYGEKLRDIEIDTVAKLLAKGRTPGQRLNLAKQTGLSEHQLTTWASHADLFRLDGVEGDYAELLEASGVESMQRLRQQDAADLRLTLLNINAEKNLARHVPSEQTVETWIRQAGNLEDRLVFEQVVDDLKLINGIGSVNEKILNEHGITSYQQVASFTSKDEQYYGELLGSFQKRIRQEQWAVQARKLHQQKYGDDV